MLSTEIITSLEDLEVLGPEWRGFESVVPGITPFQTPEWQLTWWRHFGSGDLRVYVFRTGGGELAGLVPVFRHEWLGKHQLTLVGSGISDYLEPAIAPAYPDQVICAFRDQLIHAQDWDICNWQDLGERTTLAKLALNAVLCVRREEETPCSAIPLAGSFDEYWSQRSSGLRRNVRRYRQKAEQSAALATEIADQFNPEYFHALIKLHGMRWRESGESGTIAANRSASFLEEVAQEFARRGMLRFFALRYSGQIAAVILAFPYREVLYAYLSGYDPAFAAFGFGSLLLHDALRYGFENGFAAWNFLRGEEPYKLDWGARAIAKSRLIISRAEQPKA